MFSEIYTEKPLERGSNNYYFISKGETKMKKLCSIMLAVVILMSATNLGSALAIGDDTQTSVSDDMIDNAIAPLIDSYKSEYNVIDTNFENLSQEVVDGNTVVEFTLVMSVVLKYDTVDDIGVVRGILNELGLDSCMPESNSKSVNDPIYDAVYNKMQSNTIPMALSSEESAQTLIQSAASIAATELNGVISSVEAYIGTERELCFGIRLTFDDTGVLLKTEGLNFEDYIDLSEFNLDSYDSKVSVGQDKVNSSLTLAISEAANAGITPRATSPLYYRVSAAGYGYTSNASTWCPHRLAKLRPAWDGAGRLSWTTQTNNFLIDSNTWCFSFRMPVTVVGDRSTAVARCAGRQNSFLGAKRPQNQFK